LENRSELAKFGQSLVSAWSFAEIGLRLYKVTKILDLQCDGAIWQRQTIFFEKSLRLAKFSQILVSAWSFAEIGLRLYKITKQVKEITSLLNKNTCKILFSSQFY
jgi:hypothetical protein